MKIKRYFAPDLRRAMAQMREEQGSDAVILSNKRVSGGVELVAAIDYDESMLEPVKRQMVDKELGKKTYEERLRSISLSAQDASLAGQQTAVPLPDEVTLSQAGSQAASQAATQGSGFADKAYGRADKVDKKISLEWAQDPLLVDMRGQISELRGMLENQLSGLAWGELGRREPKRVELIQRFMQFGLSRMLSQDIGSLVSTNMDTEQMWRSALSICSARVPLYEKDILEQGGIYAMVGPTGVGKTTSIAKLAARFALQHGSRQVGLVTIDNFRVGAYDQLRTYGRLLDVPVRVAEDADELAVIIDELRDRRLILVDTAGMGQWDQRLLGQLEILSIKDGLIKKILVLSATTRLAGLDEVVRAFQIFEPVAAILTKLDEATSLGGAIGISIAHDLPLAYVCDGQQVPDDLHVAAADDLINRGEVLLNRVKSESELQSFPDAAFFETTRADASI